MIDRTPILRTEGLTKTFSGTVALRDVDFQLAAGEIHAICGENGAGKSTLIKILSGLYRYGQFDGEVFLQGRPARFAGIRQAEAAGIAVIYQELALVGEMTVAENIYLGHEPTRSGFVDHQRMARDARGLLEQFGIEVEPDRPVGQLGVGMQQLVEIAKALAKDSHILILDEPTAALTSEEVRVLLQILSRLRAKGIACIYISHKLEEVFEIADRITVLRDGRAVALRQTDQTSPAEIIRDMVGRDIDAFFPRDRGQAGPVLLSVTGLSVRPPGQSGTLLQGIDLDVRGGRVLGIGGLMGAGRSELLMHLVGAWGRRLSGQVELDGQRLSGRITPAGAIARGMVLVSEDRKRFGLVLEQSVGFNLSLASLGRFTRTGLVSPEAVHRANARQIDALGIKTPDQQISVGNLSGGNQQKVVLGKALMTEPKVVLLDEPTRGIDIAAKQEVYQLINALTATGKAVVMVSSEMPELMGISDEIVMLHAGRLGGRFQARDASQEQLLAAAMGRNREG